MSDCLFDLDFSPRFTSLQNVRTKRFDGCREAICRARHCKDRFRRSCLSQRHTSHTFLEKQHRHITSHTDDKRQERMQHLQHPRVHCTISWQACALQSDVCCRPRVQVCTSSLFHHLQKKHAQTHANTLHCTAPTLRHSTRTGQTLTHLTFSRAQSARWSPTRRFAPAHSAPHSRERERFTCGTGHMTQSERREEDAGERGPWVQRSGALAGL